MTVEIYSWGLVACSVCATKTLSVEEIEASVNLQLPTGISSRWRKSGEGFNTGQPNPCPCESMPDERLHYLFNC